MKTWMASSVPLVKRNCSGRDAEIARDGLLGPAVLGIDGQAGRVERVAQSASITRGEQPTVFSLKSRRSLPARPAVGGE